MKYWQGAPREGVNPSLPLVIYNYEYIINEDFKTVDGDLVIVNNVIDNLL
jgi:hypothetical protein